MLESGEFPSEDVGIFRKKADMKDVCNQPMVKPIPSRRRGAISIDALTAVFVTALSAAAFFSLIPVVDKSQKIGRQESVANQLCNRMIEQLQLLKPSDVQATTLTQLNLIDPGQISPPYSFTNIPLDEASRYSPAQALPSGTGTLDVVALPHGSIEARVMISWRSSSGRTRTLQTGTVFGGFRRGRPAA